MAFWRALTSRIKAAFAASAEARLRQRCGHAACQYRNATAGRADDERA